MIRTSIMACTVHSPLPLAPGERPVLGRAMTRCECSGVAFEEVARRMQAEGLAAEQAVRRTGCGQNCEACLPDLRRHLAAAALAAAVSAGARD
jgi:hypothetical protein